MALFKKLLKNDAFKMVAAAGVGYAAGKFAPEIQSKLTAARKFIQVKKKTLFPNYGKQAGTPQAIEQARVEYNPALPGTVAMAGGSLLDALVNFLRRMLGGRG